MSHTSKTSLLPPLWIYSHLTMEVYKFLPLNHKLPWQHDSYTHHCQKCLVWYCTLNLLHNIYSNIGSLIPLLFPRGNLNPDTKTSKGNNSQTKFSFPAILEKQRTSNTIYLFIYLISTFQTQKNRIYRWKPTLSILEAKEKWSQVEVEAAESNEEQQKSSRCRLIHMDLDWIKQ